MAGTHNITGHINGDTWLGFGAVTVLVNGVPLDLTGASIKMQLKSGKSCSLPVESDWSTEEGSIEITDAINGIFKVNSKTVRVSSPDLTYYYDIQITLSSGRVLTIVEGTWTFISDVTF